jgi:hypothetical protein
VAPFRVETQPGSDYLVKLESTENKLFSFVFFIVGGQPFETTVPAGTYVLKYVAGKTWCGRTLLFGNKVAQRGRTLFIFDDKSWLRRPHGHAVRAAQWKFRD